MILTFLRMHKPYENFMNWSRKVSKHTYFGSENFKMMMLSHYYVIGQYNVIIVLLTFFSIYGWKIKNENLKHYDIMNLWRNYIKTWIYYFSKFKVLVLNKFFWVRIWHSKLIYVIVTVTLYSKIYIWLKAAKIRQFLKVKKLQTFKLKFFSITFASIFGFKVYHIPRVNFDPDLL